MTTLDNKRDHLLNLLQQAGRVAVAFSAGVDSTVLAKAARIACGDNAVAVIAASPSLPAGTVEEAMQLAKQIEIPLLVLPTDEFTRSQYVANQGNRCYFCKEALYETIKAHREEIQYTTIVNGANTDDLSDHRPGHLAADEHEVGSPFLEANISKTEIRELAKQWELPVWDKPASPCLSSRIAVGVEVTAERVQRVDRAESFLRKQFDLNELRVRHEHHDLARIEVPVAAITMLVEEENRQLITHEFKKFGFKYITIDLNGFQSGSMNQILPLRILTNSKQ